MASDCYTVKALSVRGRDVVLWLEAAQPDCSAFYLTKGFILQVISEAARVGDPIYDALADTDAGEPSELEAVADTFIASLRVTAHDPSWSLADATKRPEATYAVALTDARWGAHLREGAAYSSVAWVEDEAAPMLPMADPS
ncbi:MAG: hypothetical protein U0235_28170 [Polyangiaceae bacterium]